MTPCNVHGWALSLRNFKIIGPMAITKGIIIECYVPYCLKVQKEQSLYVR